MVRRKLEDIYTEFRTQIDAIGSLPGMKYRKAARIVAWFYGGSEEGWRKLLAARTSRSKIPKEVSDLLRQLTKRC